MSTSTVFHSRSLNRPDPTDRSPPSYKYLPPQTLLEDVTTEENSVPFLVRESRDRERKKTFIQPWMRILPPLKLF